MHYTHRPGGVGARPGRLFNRFYDIISKTKGRRKLKVKDDSMLKETIGNDLELRLLELRHADELYNLIDQNREHLRRWMPWVDNTKESGDTKGFIKASLKRFADNLGFDAGIWFRDRIIGVIGYHKHDWENRTARLGYWLGREGQGMGAMTRAAHRMTQWAFEDYRMHKVEIACASKNHKSRAIPKRLGFVEEGSIRDAEWLYDHFVDHIVYGLLEDEYRAAEPFKKTTGE